VCLLIDLNQKTRSFLMESVVIVGCARTPSGSLLGALSQVPAGELGAVAIAGALKQCAIDKSLISEVIMGNVLSAGVGQGPARQASRKAGIPDHVGCTTINKLCGSGLKAVMLGNDLIRAGSATSVVVGGMESMSQAPYLLPTARSGARMGNTPCLDHMFHDGLEDSDTGKLMGVFAQEMADTKNLSREAMDDFAIRSLKRAKTAQEKGWFKDEIVPVTVHTRKGSHEIIEDEQPKSANPDKIPTLKPAFKKPDGTITAANASSISDGAAALVLMSESAAKQQGLQPIARILGHASQAQHPSEFTIAPCGAIQKLLNSLDWQVKDVDLFEINEAFAMVAMVPMIELEIDADKVNIHGGACALGHPIGATGARLLVTLIHALKRTQGKTGVASLCIGGGEATALAIQVI